MDIFVNVNDKDVKLSVTYWKGRYVTLNAVYVIRNEFGYEYDPLAAKTIVLTPMKRENKSKISKLTAAVDAHKQAIANMYAQNKLEEALKLIEV